MYRIELSPGEETVFRSIEELAVAIKRGVVTPRARIWHNASSKWLPIQFHPHYKTAVSMELTPAELVVGPPVKPLSSLSLQQPADPGLAQEPVGAPARPFVGVATPSEQSARKKKKMRAEPPKGEKRSRRTTKSHRELRIALIGALLVGGAQWVLSGPFFSRAEAPTLLHPQRRFVVTAPANTAGMIPVVRTPPASFGGVGVVVQNGPPSSPAPVPAPSPDPAPVAPVDTGANSAIEPAPVTIDVAAPSIAKPDSLTTKLADSTRNKAMKGVLRAIGGAPGREKTPAQR
jgi:hypothetical protein